MVDQRFGRKYKPIKFCHATHLQKDNTTEYNYTHFHWFLSVSPIITTNQILPELWRKNPTEKENQNKEINFFAVYKMAPSPKRQKIAQKFKTEYIVSLCDKVLWRLRMERNLHFAKLVHRTFPSRMAAETMLVNT